MGISHADRLKIFENVMARTGGGKETLAAFAQAMSSLNGLQTFNELNPPQAPLQPPQAPISNQAVPSAVPQEGGLNVPQNTPTGIV
jgi:hypothetical protein